MAVIENYAHLGWAPSDVQTLRPDWTIPQCRRFLEENQNAMRDRLCELGWEVMETLLAIYKEPENARRSADESDSHSGDRA